MSLNDPEDKIPDWIETLPNPNYDGIECPRCHLRAYDFPKRLNILETRINAKEHEIFATILCRRCGHFFQWIEPLQVVDG